MRGLSVRRHPAPPAARSCGAARAACLAVGKVASAWHEQVRAYHTLSGMLAKQVACRCWLQQGRGDPLQTDCSSANVFDTFTSFRTAGGRGLCHYVSCQSTGTCCGYGGAEANPAGAAAACRCNMHASSFLTSLQRDAVVQLPSAELSCAARRQGAYRSSCLGASRACCSSF